MTDAAIQFGSEFRVTTNTLGDQVQPRVTALEGGGYLVVWSSLEATNIDYTGIYGQLYDASGVAVGREFEIHTATPRYQEEPDVTALVGGGFVVTWQSWLQDGDLQGVYGQIYDASGIAVGSEFQVNTYTTLYQKDVEVAGLSGGGFVVIWESLKQDDPAFGYGVFGQRYDASGAATGGEFQVNSYIVSDQRETGVTGLDDGGFIVTWESAAQDFGRRGIYAQRYDATGTASGGEFRVNGSDAYDRYSPAVSSIEGGGYVIVWEVEGQDRDGRGIYAQMFDATNKMIGTEFLVNSITTDDQFDARVAGLPDGGFVVIWNSDGQDGELGGIYGQRFDSLGVAIDAGFLVNTYTTDDQSLPDITVLADGGFVVAWQSNWQDRDGNGVYAQQYAPVLFGTAGDDTVLDNVGANLIEGLGGDDILKGKGGKDYVYGSAGADTLYGGAKRDKLFGGNGTDTLYGGTENDVLKGGSGDDTLEGGAGKDTMTGGTGADTFVFTDASESATNANADVIKDFVSGEDFIDFSNMVGGLIFIDTASFSGALEVRAVASGADVLVRVDVDGDGSADMKVVLEGVANVTGADFIL